MVNETWEKPDMSGGRRDPPTIDLTAKEIATDVPVEKQTGEQPKSAAADAKSADENETSRPQPRDESQRESSAWPFQSAILVAGGAGSVAAAVLMLWLGGVFRIGDVAEPQLAQIDRQLHDLAMRSPDAKTFDELSARLLQLEASLSGRVTSAENALKVTTDNLAAVSRQIDETANVAREMRGELNAAPHDPQASRAELELLANRLTDAERNLKATDAELAKRIDVSPSDRAGRLAIAALSLQGAMLRGEPFSNELAAAQALSPDARGLAALTPFAASGLPRPQVLTAELDKLTPQMRRIATENSGELGFVGKLQQNAERLVRIRPVSDSPGDDPVTVIDRISFRSAQHDVVGALAELRKLPTTLRAPADDWIRRVAARNAAMDSISQFTTNAVATLSKTGS